MPAARGTVFLAEEVFVQGWRLKWFFFFCLEEYTSTAVTVTVTPISLSHPLPLCVCLKRKYLHKKKKERNVKLKKIMNERGKIYKNLGKVRVTNGKDTWKLEICTATLSTVWWKARKQK